jgi:flagellar basal body-associated protein FliL
MENSLINELDAPESTKDKRQTPHLNNNKMEKKSTMIAITLFFTLFTIATFSGIIIWQTYQSKQEEKSKEPESKNQQPDTIVIAR